MEEETVTVKKSDLAKVIEENEFYKELVASGIVFFSDLAKVVVDLFDPGSFEEMQKTVSQKLTIQVTPSASKEVSEAAEQIMKAQDEIEKDVEGIVQDELDKALDEAEKKEKKVD